MAFSQHSLQCPATSVATRSPFAELTPVQSFQLFAGATIGSISHCVFNINPGLNVDEIMAMIQLPRNVRKPAIEHPQTDTFSFKYVKHFAYIAVVIANCVWNKKYMLEFNSNSFSDSCNWRTVWYVKLLHALIRNLFSVGDCLCAPIRSLDHLSKRQVVSFLSSSRNNQQSHIINILLASFARSVRQVMDPRFFPSLFSWPARFALGP